MLITSNLEMQMDIIFLSYSCQKSPSIRKKIYLKFKYHSGKIFHKNLYWKKKTINSSLYSKNWNILRCSRRISYFSKRKLKLATCFRRKKTHPFVPCSRHFFFFFFRSLGKFSKNFIHCSSFA